MARLRSEGVVSEVLANGATIVREIVDGYNNKYAFELPADSGVEMMDSVRPCVTSSSRSGALRALSPKPRRAGRRQPGVRRPQVRGAPDREAHPSPLT
jgi:hypothetical protein